jgi:hypothetical protein
MVQLQSNFAGTSTHTNSSPAQLFDPSSPVANPTVRRLSLLHDPIIASSPEGDDANRDLKELAMTSIKNIFAAIVFSAGLSVAAQAAETVKPLQGVSFHTETKDAAAYFLADKGTCKIIVTVAEKTAYAPARIEKAVEAHNAALYQVDDGKALEFACQDDAQTMTVNLLTTVAANQ